MTNKSIEIPEEIYNKLLKLKQEDESLTDFIIRLIEKPDNNHQLKILQESLRRIQKNGNI
ncbi:MAG: hypothetical protein GF383_10260 [Candidatus Lokiarchaeota archaeon]|nr:hypothetical protein [Candidatus Lokiarchaeota archaeon]MBD3340939.1 hypothetical protein [Candidatus Lokiarchaeota archaeon]